MVIIMMNMEELHDNVSDWFYTKCAQSEYETDDDYVDELRSTIACDNEPLIDSCIEDLSELYYTPEWFDVLSSYRDSIREYLIQDAKFSFDNFKYRS